MVKWYTTDPELIAEMEANAKLVAASPSMLYALRLAEAKLLEAEYHLDKGQDDSICFECEILTVRAAIAKALA
ncbi:hypothetical protein D3C78_1650350 [compost metagenome]